MEFDRFAECKTIDQQFDEVLADKIYDLIGVDRRIGDRSIKILDQNEAYGLYLLHYVEDASIYDFVKGIIICIENNQPRVICRSFPYTEEITLKEYLANPKKHGIFGVDKHYVAMMADEGTILRVFYCKDRWFTSSHKRIDGRCSKWAGPCFGQLFDEAWSTGQGSFVEGKPDFDSVLNRGYAYTFLVSHPHNRLVNLIPKPTLKLTAIFEPFEITMCYLPLTSETLPVLICKDPQTKLPFEIVDVFNIENEDQLINRARPMDWKLTTGLLLYDPRSEKCFKIVPDAYLTYRRIRGNEPNVKIRYIELLMHNGKHDLLRSQFPEHETEFQVLFKKFQELPNYIQRCYVKRFIERKRETFSQEIHHFIVGLNREHRYAKNIGLDIIIKAIGLCKPQTILKMVMNL